MNSPRFTATFLAVKLVDIGLVTVYFFVFGLAVAKVFDVVYGDFSEEHYDRHSTLRLFAEVVLHLFAIGVAAYVLRNLVGAIPFPLEGVAGFQHARLKELGGGTALAIVLILFQKNLRDKLTYFADRVLGVRTPPSAEMDAGGDVEN